MKKKKVVISVVLVGALVMIGALVIVKDTDSIDEVEYEETVVETAYEETEYMKEVLTDLYAGAIVETETAEEEEFIQSTAGDTEIVNDEVEDMDAVMYATQNVNLRKGTAVTTESLRLVSFCEKVNVTGISENKQWYRVEDTEKGEGFIASSYLSDTKPQQNTSSQQASSGSSESTQSSGGSTGGLTSSQQSEIERMKAELSGLGPNLGPNMEPAMEGGGGHHLNE